MTKKKKKINQQYVWAEQLLDELRGDYGDSLEDVDAWSVLDILGVLGLSFIQSDAASNEFMDGIVDAAEKMR